MEDTFKKGIGYEAMDPSIVEEYGRADVLSCLEVYESQLSDYRKPEFIGLRKVREMMNEMLLVLLEMERNGIYIDMQELASVEKEFAQEKNILEKLLTKKFSFYRFRNLHHKRKGVLLCLCFA